MQLENNADNLREQYLLGVHPHAPINKGIKIVTTVFCLGVN